MSRERPWTPQRPRLHPARVVVEWLLSALALLVAAAIVPGVHITGFWGAVLAAALIGILNGILPPLVAALRLPYTVGLTFVLVLVLDALLLQLAAEIAPGAIAVDDFGWALLAALIASAVGIALEVIFGTNDDDSYDLRVVQRIAARGGGTTPTSTPGIVFLEIDGLSLPVLRRALRDGSAPEMARWLAEDTHRLVEWETDLSSQTGASQAGILLGSNHDIPAFRWVEKETGRMMTCSAPADCAEIERRRATGAGLLAGGGASRGNLLSGEAEQALLTVSRIEAEKRANPGYRAFYANGFNVTRTLVLVTWEVLLEWTASIRAIRRDVRPRGHRGGVYPLLRAAMCVAVRDLVVHSVLTDMMAGRPAVYATFASYDEVAHHSGMERADTLEALRKLDQQFGRIARARPYAARPYEIVVLSDHGQTQGATFRQRNGEGLEDVVRGALAGGTVAPIRAGDENDTTVGLAIGEATGRGPGDEEVGDAVGGDAIVLGSGNLGLVYLMESERRLTREEIDARHPELIPTLRSHPHVGFLLVRSAAHGALVLGPHGERRLADGTVVGDDPLAPFSPTAGEHLLRADGFPHVADIMINSFYDPELDEGCAFEELISFHGGMGGSQTRPFLMYPVVFPPPPQPIAGAEAVHAILSGWRAMLQDGDAERG